MTRTLTAAAVISLAVLGGGTINVFVAVLAAQPAPLPIGAPAPPPAPPPPGIHPWAIPDRGVVSVYVTRVIDGDTVEACFLSGPVHLRLAGVQAPELKAPGGAASRDALRGQLENKVIAADLRGRDKYRWAVFDAAPDGKTWVSQWMVANHFAVVWNGEGPKP